MSTVDLDKLQKGLAADRANARYSDEELRQGHSVPPLPGEAPPASAVLAQDGTAAPQPGQPPAPGQATGHSPPAKGSATAPQESPLTTPSVRSLPEGEMPTAAPPPPGGDRPRQEAALPAAATPSPRALPVAPPPSATEPAVMRAPGGRQPAVTLEAAQISFAVDGKTLSAQDNQQLAEVAKLQKQGGASVRVIGYGRGGYGPDAARQELDSFGDALDRANAVAQALAKLGVPARRITVQAAPEPLEGGPAAGQAEVLLDY